MDFLHSFDFVTQEKIDSGDLQNPPDGLSHHAYAHRLLKTIQNLPPGAVVGVQAAWGRGKTDVLSRLATFAMMMDEDNKIRHVFWLNPWQYGTNDLLTPLVLEMLSKGETQDPSFINRPGILKALKSLILAGTNFGLKATAKMVPGYGLLELAAGPAEAVLKALFEARGDEIKSLADAVPDPDPVSKMGEQFRFLVDNLLEEKNRDRKILICVDDLDRCLPERQIAMLEAMRFLVSSRANAVFVIGMDETSIGESLRAYYQIGRIDAAAYLDKMFDIRTHLPAVSAVKHTELLNQFLDMEWQPERSVRDVINAPFDMNESDMIVSIRDALCVERAKRPRVMKKFLTKLCLLCDGNQEEIEHFFKSKTSGSEISVIFKWILISQEWPDFRRILQEYGDQFYIAFKKIVPQMRNKPPDLIETEWRPIADFVQRGLEGELVAVVNSIESIGSNEEGLMKKGRLLQEIDQLLLKFAL